MKQTFPNTTVEDMGSGKVKIHLAPVGPTGPAGSGGATGPTGPTGSGSSISGAVLVYLVSNFR